MSQDFRLKDHAALLASMVLLITSSIAASDIYLPTLPDLQAALHISEASAQHTISIFFIGMVIGNLGFGPLSDRIGRKKTLYLAFLLSIMGGLICWTAHTLNPIYIGRVLQGLASGGLVVIVRASCRDLFSGPDLVKFAGTVGSFVGFIPPLAPLAGGYVGDHFGWRANFLAMLISIVISGICALIFMPETLSEEKRLKNSVSKIASQYFGMLVYPEFIAYSVGGGMIMAALMAYITESPFLLRTQLGLDAVTYGWISAAIAPCMLIGTAINHRIASRFHHSKLLLIGNLIFLVAVLINLALASLKIFTIYAIIGPAMLLMVALGMTFPAAFAGATHAFSKAAGTASAFYGAVNSFCGSFGSWFVTLWLAKDQMPLASTQLIFAVITIFMSLLAVHLHKKDSREGVAT